MMIEFSDCYYLSKVIPFEHWDLGTLSVIVLNQEEVLPAEVISQQIWTFDGGRRVLNDDARCALSELELEFRGVCGWNSQSYVVHIVGPARGEEGEVNDVIGSAYSVLGLS